MEINDPKHNPRVLIPAYGLWFLSSVLSVLAFIAGREAIIRSYTRFFPWDAERFATGQGSLSMVNIAVAFPLAFLVIAIVIGGFEYQHRNMGQPRAWRFLAQAFAVEIGILLLAFFI